MKIQKRGPANLDEVLSSIQGMERRYGMTTHVFRTCQNPTLHIPEDDASRWALLIEQQDVLREGDHSDEGDWTPSYKTGVGRPERLPAVDRELAECGVAA